MILFKYIWVELSAFSSLIFNKSSESKEKWLRIIFSQSTCSKSAIEKLEKNVKFGSKLTIKTPGTYFTPCFSVSVVTFELVNADWVLSEIFPNIWGLLRIVEEDQK